MVVSWARQVFVLGLWSMTFFQTVMHPFPAALLFFLFFPVLSFFPLDYRLITCNFRVVLWVLMCVCLCACVGVGVGVGVGVLPQVQAVLRHSLGLCVIETLSPIQA